MRSDLPPVPERSAAAVAPESSSDKIARGVGLILEGMHELSPPERPPAIKQVLDRLIYRPMTMQAVPVSGLRGRLAACRAHAIAAMLGYLTFASPAIEAGITFGA